MCTISLRSRSRNEIIISNFKGFVLLLPTQTFFYFMPVALNFVCEINNEAHLYAFQTDKRINICICEKDECEDDYVYNNVILSKQDVKRLIKEFNLSKQDVKRLIKELNLLIKNIN